MPVQLASVDDFRDYLTLSEDVPTADLAGVLQRVSGVLLGELRFSFGGPVVTAVLDGTGREKLWLPPPGAASIISISEDSADLSDAEFELDPKFGLFLLRLDFDEPAVWSAGRRNITIQYTPSPPPGDLMEVCLEEATRTWNGKPGGFTDTSGVAGSTETTTGRYLTARTHGVLRSVRAIYDPMRQAGRG